MADPHFVVAVLDTSGNLVNAGDSANSLIRVSIVGGGGGGVTGSISAGTTKGTLGEVVFSNSPTVTFGMDGQTVTASAVGGAGGGVALSAGTQSVNTGTVVFANSNGMTFGMSGSSQVTASYTVPSTAGLLSAVNVSAGTTSNNLSAVTFANGGGVSFGLDASTVTATVRTDWLSTQSNQAFSAGAASSAFQTLVFNDANGVTWSNNAGSVQASYSQSTHSHSTAPGAIAAGTQTATSGTVVFANSNGISFGMSGSSQVTATYTVPSTAGLLSAVNVSAGTTSNNLSALTFNNGGGVSFGLNASTVTATVATTYRASNDAVGLNTAQSNVTWTVNSAGLSLDARGYAGTGTSATNASITLNSNGLAISVAAPGGGGTTNQTGPNIADGNGNTITSGTVVFSNSNGVSFGLNGSTMTASVNAAAGGTATMWWPFNEAVNVMGQQGNGTWHVVAVPTPAPAALGEVQIDRVCFPILVSNSSNSTGSATVSISMGIYTKNNSSLSLAHSTTGTLAVTYSGTVNNSTYAGIRLLTVPWTTTIGDGRYYVAIASRTTTGGTNCTISQVLASQLNSNFSGLFGVNSNRSMQWPLGFGVYSASSSGFPNPIPFSQLDGTASLGARPPSWFMISGTV